MEIEYCLSLFEVNTLVKDNLLILDGVAAIFNVCFMGDRFLEGIFNELETMLQQARMNNDAQKFYLKKYYNVAGFFDTTGIIKEGLARVVNAMIEGVNTKHKLPRFMVVILDKDVIEDLNFFEFGSYKALAEVTNWLTIQISIVIQRKKLELNAKKLGVVYSGDPKVIYVQMLRQTEMYKQGSHMQQVCKLRPKFNESLNQAVARLDQNLLHIRSCDAESHFDDRGNLSLKGKHAFWHKIDELLDCSTLEKLSYSQKIWTTGRNKKVVANQTDGRSDGRCQHHNHEAMQVHAVATPTTETKI